MGPVKPQSIASAAETTPMSTVRCLKMRFSVSSVLQIVDEARELVGPGADVLLEAGRHVLVHAAGAEIVGVQTGAADALVELHQVLALLEPPEQRRHRTDIQREGREVQQVVEDPRELREQHPDVLRRARGTSMPSSLSVASANACSWHIGET